MAIARMGFLKRTSAWPYYSFEFLEQLPAPTGGARHLSERTSGAERAQARYVTKVNASAITRIGWTTLFGLSISVFPSSLPLHLSGLGNKFSLNLAQKQCVVNSNSFSLNYSAGPYLIKDRGDFLLGVPRKDLAYESNIGVVWEYGCKFAGRSLENVINAVNCA